MQIINTYFSIPKKMGIKCVSSGYRVYSLRIVCGNSNLLDINWINFIQLYQKGTFEVRCQCFYMVVDILICVYKKNNDALAIGSVEDLGMRVQFPFFWNFVFCDWGGSFSFSVGQRLQRNLFFRLPPRARDRRIPPLRFKPLPFSP